jgi:hypothetical protein
MGFIVGGGSAKVMVPVTDPPKASLAAIKVSAIPNTVAVLRTRNYSFTEKTDRPQRIKRGPAVQQT